MPQPSSRLNKRKKSGVIAQLVEYLVYTEFVGGSIPSNPKIDEVTRQPLGFSVKKLCPHMSISLTEVSMPQQSWLSEASCTKLT